MQDISVIREKNRLIQEKKRLENPAEYYRGVSERVKRWREKYPEKTKAHKKVFVEMRAGRMTRKPCFCGSLKSEAHHPDYSKPLEVIWLCKKHHRMADRNELAIPLPAVSARPKQKVIK